VLLNVVQDNNIKQLQHDLGKVLMSVKQGFTHIIVYNPSSVKQAVADALKGKANPRVYYPSENGVDKVAVIDQFVNQLLFREGSCRSRGNPVSPFEVTMALSTMSKNKTVKMHGDEKDDGEEHDEEEEEAEDDDDEEQDNDTDDEANKNIRNKGELYISPVFNIDRFTFSNHR
jgi:hypothetical protein